MAPNKQQQMAEARNRQAQNNKTGIDTSEVPSDPIADNTGPEGEVPVTQARTEQPIEGETRPKPIVQSPKDRARDDIVKSFREQRNLKTDDDADEINKFTRSGMPPELLALEDETLVQGEPEEQEEQIEETQEELLEEEQVPAKRKLIIRGKEVEVTDEEFLALAQKAAAADDYLDEAKRKLKEVDELVRQTRTQAGRDSQTNTQNGQNNPQNNGQEDPNAPGDEHHVDPFEKVVETIQFGDLKEAARLLREVSTNPVDTRKIAGEQLEQERMRNEAIRSQKILKEFEGQHPDLAKDQYALAAMRARLIELQTDDLKGLGLDEAQIPKSGDEIANWHMWYRQKGHSVRDVDVLLKTARDDFMAWRGVETKQPAATKTGAPRVEVTVDRQQRRAAIQQQPSRTVAPKPDQVTQPTPQRDRSSIVQDMIAARGRPRQKVVVQ